MVYGNRRHVVGDVATKTLQDLKDRYRDRLTLIHILSARPRKWTCSRAAYDADKVKAVVAFAAAGGEHGQGVHLRPRGDDRAPPAGLLEVGVRPDHIYTERFTANTPAALARCPPAGVMPRASGQSYPHRHPRRQGARDGDGAHEHVLDVALDTRLDLPFSCKAGVCRLPRQGDGGQCWRWTDQRWRPPGGEEIDQGFVLAARPGPASGRLLVSFDER